MRQQIDTNLVGSIQVIRAALPHLRAQGGGRILQVSSEGGQIAYPGFSLYHATKWGIEGFVEAVSQEVAPFNIEFTIIESGPTATDFGKGMVSTPPTAVYEDTPVGEIRRAWSSGRFSVRGDAQKTARAMIDCAGLRSRAQTAHVGERRVRTSSCGAGSETHRAARSASDRTLNRSRCIRQVDQTAPSRGTRVRDSWVTRQRRRSHTGCLRQVHVLASQF